MLIQDLDSIPSKLVIKKGNTAGGQGFSWTLYVYILNSEFPDAIPEEEELPLHVGGNIEPFELLCQAPLPQEVLHSLA